MSAQQSTTHRDPPNLSHLAHRRLIGILGLGLPVAVYLLAGLRHTNGLSRWEILDSVSAYYYTGSVGVFVGVLFALSLFLFTYPGYEGFVADRIVGAVGGTAALGVALFPTGAPVPLAEPNWWNDNIRIIHYVSAATLFIAFTLFSLWLFRKSDIPRRHDRPVDKRRRDDVCLACGVVMIICVVWAGVAGFQKAPIFLPEAIAIIAFAVSWLTKGEAYRPVMNTWRRVRKTAH